MLKCYMQVAIGLDIFLAYLRRAFHCCYYCAVVADHEEELIRKCIKHERRSEPEEGAPEKTKADLYAEERWAESLDHKMACLLDKTRVDPLDYGGTRYAECVRLRIQPNDANVCIFYRELSNIAGPFAVREEDSKWRCKLCMKLFKDAPFVEKHVVNKHADQIQSQLQEVSVSEPFTSAHERSY